MGSPGAYDQNTERQLDRIKIDKVFTDKASGKDTDRPQLQGALDYIRDGDTLVIHSMDRLARNVEDMLRLVRELTGKGIAVQFIKEDLTFTGDESPMNILMLTVLGAFAQFERGMIRERQREGIAKTKARGDVYKGRRPALNDAQVRLLRARVAEGVPKTTVAKEFHVSRETLYKYLSE